MVRLRPPALVLVSVCGCGPSGLHVSSASLARSRPATSVSDHFAALITAVRHCSSWSPASSTWISCTPPRSKEKLSIREHPLPALRPFRLHHQELRGVLLIQDGGSSHVAGDTRRYFAESGGRWRPRYTPANASWLNQAEILIHSFKHYHLKRGSWRSQEEFRSHVLASWPEYNRRYAHPIEWAWTNQKMRQWFERHAPNSLQEL